MLRDVRGAGSGKLHHGRTQPEERQLCAASGESSRSLEHLLRARDGFLKLCTLLPPIPEAKGILMATLRKSAVSPTPLLRPSFRAYSAATSTK